MRCAVLLLSLVVLTSAAANLSRGAEPTGDWPMWGGTSNRHNATVARRTPLEWNVGEFDRKADVWLKKKARNIKWVARLGSQSYGTPVVAVGRI